MSKLRRPLARRDKARRLLLTVEARDESKRPLNVPELQSKLLADIPGQTLHLPDVPLSYEWETIGIVARISAILGDSRFPMGCSASYIPLDKKETWLRAFQQKIDSNDPLQVLDLLIEKTLNFNV
mgnify:CR=1 FL=1|tara:strand:- start:5097 stop:5471 length:375 start_codon:yes stop_codon:yes gene_type:complete